MKKIYSNIIPAFIAVLAMMFLYGCNNDDGYSLGNFEFHYVTVKVPAENNPQKTFYLVDYGLNKKYWVAAPIYVNKTLEDGQRALVNITLLSDKQGEFDHYVRLNSLDKVTTKDIEVLKKDQEDKFGSDVIGLVASNFFGGVRFDLPAIDVAYTYFNPYASQKVSLILNENSKYDEDEYLHLELRNMNKENVDTSKYVLGRVSFKLDTLKDIDLENYKGIKIHYKNLKGLADVVSHNFEVNKPEEVEKPNPEV